MDESTNNTDTPETKAAAVVETTPTPAKRSQDPQQAQLTLGMTPDQVAAHTSAVARAIEAEAKLKAAHKAKEAEAAAKESESASVKAVKAEERLNTLEASNKNLMDQVRRAKALEVLPGLKDPATFLPLVDELVVLDENHALTEASCTAIASWAKERQYLFESMAGGATTPAASAGHLTADGAFTGEENRMFQQIGVVPGAYKNTEAWNKIGWIFGHDSRKGGE